MKPRLLDFPGAPANAFVSDEGWLLIGQEAWTVQEWRGRATSGKRPRTADGEKYGNRYTNEWERRLARNRSRTAYRERQRGAA
jgi:hypothetical protein